MYPQRISYLVVVCLLLIFTTQIYLVYDQLLSSRISLTRESNAIIEDAFRKELNQRNAFFKHILGEDSNITSPPPTNLNSVHVDMRDKLLDKENVLMLLDLTINGFISKSVPMNLHNLDSITETILQSRNIHSEFQINIVDPTTGKVLRHSDKKNKASILVVPSKLLQTDLDNQKSLQLILINPFGLIIKQMSLLLVSSMVLSFICLLSFRFIVRVLVRQKQLVAFKNEFLGTIAHELKRPVASLSFNLDCLAMPSIIGNRQQHELLVNKCLNATSELNDTINMIISLAKLEEGLLVLNNEPVNLKKMFEDLKNKFSSYPVKKVEIQTICESNEMLVLGDRNLLNQCFANLIDNAIKYSNTEVLIVITIRKTGHWILVSIKDNGFGIPKEKLSVIFDNYTRVHQDNTKINGFGIGLNYVKTIVEKHKGEVDVNSQSGEGSEFKVLLPD